MGRRRARDPVLLEPTVGGVGYLLPSQPLVIVVFIIILSVLGVVEPLVTGGFMLARHR